MYMWIINEVQLLRLNVAASVAEIQINKHPAMEITWQHNVRTTSRALYTTTFR
jgi:hypothetical protein